MEPKMEQYICDECHQVFYESSEEKVEKCPFCESDNIDRSITLEELVKEYVCENCLEPFTCIDSDKIVCPHCNYVQENDEEFDYSILEPDYEIDEEEF